MNARFCLLFLCCAILGGVAGVAAVWQWNDYRKDGHMAHIFFMVWNIINVLLCASVGITPFVYCIVEGMKDYA